MNTGLFALATVSFFMIHEFEEIVRFYSWTRLKKWPTAKFFGHLHGAYTSTETVAIMIAEEFALVSCALIYAAATHNDPLAIAIAIVIAIHLVGHLVAAVITRKWLPGSITGILTLIAYLIIIGKAITITQLDASALLPYILVSGGVLLANLIALHAGAKHIEHWRKRW